MWEALEFRDGRRGNRAADRRQSSPLKRVVYQRAARKSTPIFLSGKRVVDFDVRFCDNPAPFSPIAPESRI